MSLIALAPKGKRLVRDSFSLVEVVIALGIVSFCIFAIVSLFSVGLRSARESEDEIRAANVASSLLARMRAAPKADLRGEGFPFRPLTNDGGLLFQAAGSSPWFLNGDGTKAANAQLATTTRGYAMTAEGSFNPTNRIATITFTLWSPAVAAYESAKAKFRISTFVDTEAP